MLSPDSKSPPVAICAIDGMAGIGKTTFAIHWAHHFEDGQLHVNLHGFDSSASAMTPVDALNALLCSLGLPAGHIPDDLDARAGLYRSVLAGKHVLIVLDNARDVDQIRPLLPGSAGCLVIATSRNPLAGLAMTEGARLLTLKLPSVLTARATLTRAYAVELSGSTDTCTDRREALVRLFDHYLHSNHAAPVELKPDREPIAPRPTPGVTPEQFSDYASLSRGSPPNPTCSTRQSRWPPDQISGSSETLHGPCRGHPGPDLSIDGPRDLEVPGDPR
jgi:hypothetical protein